MSDNKNVAAAVATLLIKDNKLLLGKRMTSTAFEGWQCPGGYLLYGQSVEFSAAYHCRQKAGIEITDMTAGPFTNNLFDEQHTVTLYMIARQHQVTDKALYTDEHKCWNWFALDELPESLYLPLAILLQEYDLRQLIEA